MPSPFPGMDPFIEAFWSDFHGSFGFASKQLLNPHLPDDLATRIETDVYLRELSAEEREIGKRRRIPEADASVNIAEDAFAPGRTRAAAVAAAEPTAVGFLPGVVEERVRKVVVRDTFREEIVTVIELLSPTNKVRHRDAYEQKRRALLDTPAHLVEIDLLRQGRRLPIDDCPESDFLVTVSVAERRPAVDLWAFSLRDPLPVIPIPLRDGAVAPFDLRGLLDLIYGASEYDRQIYARPPDPPLPPADAVWAADVLTAAGRRLPRDFPPAPPTGCGSGS